jgi:hypothetical protein
MNIHGRYSFNNGTTIVSQNYAALLTEVETAIANIDAAQHLTKTSKEKTMVGKLLYSPTSLNKAFKYEFSKFGRWTTPRISCSYNTSYYVPGYTPPSLNSGSFREMDFVKQKLGVEVQFGKYAFMVYNVCAKMTIFHKQGFINAGIEVVPMKAFANRMSTGVSYFEQFTWDLDQRGVSNIDIPVLVLGIGA